LLPKNESVLNILGYFLEQFQIFSRGLQRLEYTLKCSQLISSSDNKKILLTTRNVRLNSGRCATKYYFFIEHIEIEKQFHIFLGNTTTPTPWLMLLLVLGKSRVNQKQ
jgi:hypothetical protein